MRRALYSPSTLAPSSLRTSAQAYSSPSVVHPLRSPSLSYPDMASLAKLKPSRASFILSSKSGKSTSDTQETEVPLDMGLTAEELATLDEDAAADSDSSKFRQLLAILRKALNVKDLTGLRVSLPANLMEPIGNLEFWMYGERPDVSPVVCASGGTGPDLGGAFSISQRWVIPTTS